MIKTVEEVYAEFTKQYPDGPKDLASGFPSRDTSDVDVTFFSLNHSSLDDIFPAPIFTKEIDSELVTMYCTTMFGREVNVYATSCPKLAARAVTHRKNELALAKQCPLLLQQVINLKTQGVKTEPAWVQAMGLVTEDPYELMLTDLTSFALAKEKELELSNN